MNRIRILLPAFSTLVVALLITSLAMAASTNAAELDPVWLKVKDGVGGTYGKLASLGIVAASIWNREKIGMLAMGAGIVIGVMVPTLPNMIDKIGTVTV